MKKFLAGAALTLFATVALGAGMPQYIITDCGTVHQIPDNASEREAIEAVDKWSEIDCASRHN